MMQSCAPSHFPEMKEEAVLLDESGNEIVERKSTSYALAAACKVRFRECDYDTNKTKFEVVKQLLEPVTRSNTLELPTKEGKQSVGEWNAIKLKNGNVFVCGRRLLVKVPYFAIWIFDTRAKKALSGPRIASLKDRELTMLSDGRVLLTGGLDSSEQPSAIAEIYDPKLSAVGDCGKLITPRVHHSSIQLNDGNVVIVGGEIKDFATSPKEVLDSVELLDLKQKTFTSAPRLAIERSHAILIPFERSRVYVVGGWHVRDNLWGDLRWVRVSETVELEQKVQ